MASIRRVLNPIRRHSRMRNRQLNRRDIHDEEIHNSLRNIKKTTKDCIELHKKLEKDKHFETNSKYLAQANALLHTVDIYREQLNLPWPEMREVNELKVRNDQLSREKQDVENHLEDVKYCLEEALLEIGRLQVRLVEQHEVGDIGTKTNHEIMSKRPDEDYLDDESDSDDEWNSSFFEGQQPPIGFTASVQSRTSNVYNDEAIKKEEKCQLTDSPLPDKLELLKRENNSSKAIADLTDPNRPMRLAEKVLELYDNEWVEAMENLENDCKIEEIEAIKVLLDIVKNVFTTFEDIGDAQTDFITSLELPIAVPDIDDLRETARPLLNTGMLTKLQVEITKALKDYRKTSCEAVSPLLFEVMKSRLQRVHTMDADVIGACDQFIKDTVSYFWMMRVQDPPVHIEWEFPHGEELDHDRLLSYTKTGDSVDYVVWPILYMHKSGPMLAKGVAQGMKSKPK